MRKSMVVLIVLVLMVAAGVVRADLELLAPLHSWDVNDLRWENGNCDLWFDASWQPFYEKLAWDNDLYDPVYSCTGAETTKWAGQLEIGLYHTDNDPLGAPGFEESGNWWLVPCADFGGGTVKDPTHVLAICGTDLECTVVGTPDAVVLCTTGNCLDEIVTELELNLDTDCNTSINDPDILAAVNGDGLCVYWEALTPDASDPLFVPWKGNFQARINQGGGDKTINFKLFGPTAITFLSFAASSGALGVPLAVALVALGALVVGGVAVVYRRRKM
jgi:hypothetical protein